MFNLTIYFWLAAVGGYWLGTLNSGYYWARRRGIDLRQFSSGTAGATNAGRIGGKKVFALIMLLDALKGAVAVGLTIIVLGDNFYGGAALFGVASGHIFPIQLNFRGGKGLASTWGGMWLLSWQTTAIMSAVAIAAKLLLRVLRSTKIPARSIDGIIIVTAYPLLAAFFLPLDLELLAVAITILLLSRQFPRVQFSPGVAMNTTGASCETAANRKD